MRAALLVGHISGALSNERSRNPGEVLANLNQSLVGRVSGGFVTCCCARFYVDGTVTVANAGHPAPYCGGREVEVEAWLPLGVVGGVAYARAALDRQFVMVSDGIVEAEDAQRELFGFDRTREISTKSAQEISEVAKQWGQNGDITVVTVRRSA
jgi:serine phosphatase RsbU (regulator of sigma subunit)